MYYEWSSSSSSSSRCVCNAGKRERAPCNLAAAENRENRKVKMKLQVVKESGERVAFSRSLHTPQTLSLSVYVCVCVSYTGGKRENDIRNVNNEKASAKEMTSTGGLRR